MTDDQLELRLRDWYGAEVPVDLTAPAPLRSSLAAIPEALPLRRRVGARRPLTLLAAAALLTAAIVGAALLAGSRADDLTPVVIPSRTPSVEPSTRSVEPSIAPVPGVIVYTRWKTLRDGEEDCTTSAVFCHRATVYISNDDGSDERVLVPGPRSYVLAASPVGPDVLIRTRDADGDHTYLTDVTGSPPRRLETDCQAPCGEDWYGFTFSPDGTRLAWIRSLTDEHSVIAIMDMSTGAVEQ